MSEADDKTPSEDAPEKQSLPSSEAEGLPVEVTLDLEYDPVVNFALQVNDVPVIKRLRIKNEGSDLHEVTLTSSTRPDLSEAVEIQIGSLKAGAEFRLDRLPLRWQHEQLATLQEKMPATLTLTVSAADRADRHFRHPVNVLAVNEWPGMALLPEILAAFVLPNTTAVNRILASSLRVHEERVTSPVFDGYQSGDPATVVEQIRSIYEGLAREDLGYVSSPASFEEEGQKVRLPDDIAEHRLGNCLDLSLLAAGLLEQSGLHPVVILLRDHAFCGAWTSERSFPEAAVDDAATLRKRIDLEDIVVFESTLLAKRPLVPFHTARSDARSLLEDNERFTAVIDVKTARKLKILPLPLSGSHPSSETSADPITTRISVDDLSALDQDADETVRILPEDRNETRAISVQAEQSRMDRWQRKLLDLSLRNRLLNYRDTRKNLRLLIPELEVFENALQEGVVFRLEARPGLNDESSPRDLQRFRERTHENADEELLKADLAERLVHADIASGDLDRALLDLYRAGKSSLEESGANTLYLALGFLSWFETEDSGIERRAPIILIPMQLTRRSVQDGFRLRRSEEDARINTTLLEKLKQDFQINTDGLASLPEGEHGIEVKQILNAFRKTVVDIPRWDIREDAALGLFSFNKFLMWADLEARSESLLASPVVKHLVETPGAAFEPDAAFPDPADLDAVLPAEKNLCPLDADSSQLSAVLAAAAGRTFVLQGPPGTGKSQTITNLIAYCLAHGKRVLFVAEKMAALNVVHDRLSRVGLESLCLEIHSNKSSKRHVLEQLRQSVEAAEEKEPEDWSALADELTSRRDDLNAYVEAIHQRHAPGLSIYQATSRLTDRRHLESVDLALGPEVQRTELDELYELVDALSTAAHEVWPINQHGLAATAVSAWGPKLGAEIEEAALAVRAAALELRTARTEIAGPLGLPADEQRDSRRILELLAQLGELLLDNPGTTRALLTENGWRSIRRNLDEGIARGRALADLRHEVEQRYADELLATDVSGWVESLRRARSSFPPLSWFRIFFARRALKPFARVPLPDTDTLVLDLSRIQKVRSESRHLDETSTQDAGFFGHFWRGAASDWDHLDRILDWTGSLRDIISELGGDPEWAASGFRECTLSVAAEENDSLTGRSPLRQGLERFTTAWKSFHQRLAVLSSLTELDERLAFGDETEERFSGRLDSTLSNQIAALPGLKTWCHWSRLAKDARNRGLSHLVNRMTDATLSPSDATDVFEKSFLEQWLVRQLENSELLQRFNSRDHERKIRSFAKLDERLIRLSSQVIRARAHAEIPGFAREASSNSEVGILQRQLKLKRRHLPIRRLFESLPELLPRLKPCLLMSPLSVAQYLNPDYPHADIVVFDEASQIPVWDAIGALARGRSAIVVGDSRQLPPTTFFRAQDGEDDEGDGALIEEVESILDECEAGGLTSMKLAWHYRSRDERLIAFSNHHYYDNRLRTFPAPGGRSDDTGVVLQPVPEGVYDRSGSRTNETEARAVVEAIIMRLQAEPETSIGVVAFSRAQQSCIEDLLDTARRAHPELEEHFGEGREEPVFVKNLENVQGDERDVILFSVCYGPDTRGRVSMNFGPLNREGGERRLNVAVTRARRELRVFATLRPEQINLSRSRALGVAHLKAFLEYAERGPDSLPYRPEAATEEIKSPLVNAIASALRERGHTVQTHVGCSAQPVDVAISDPENPDHFVLGIECDGKGYRDAHTARDRDRLRTGVLERLGWALCRVWSSDWLANPEAELARIENILAGSPSTPASDEPTAPESIENASFDSDTTVILAQDTAEESDGETLDLKLVEEVEIYRPALLEAVTGADDALYDEGHRDQLLGMITAVISHEAPLSTTLLTRRLMDATGIDRLTSRVRRRVEELVDALPADARPSLHDGVLFAHGTSPESYDTFRTAALGEIPRQADDLHPIEVANAARRVLKEQIALPMTDLPKETARMLGFPRLGSRVKAAMEKGIEELVGRGWGIVDNGQVRQPRTFPDQDIS